MNSAPYVLYGVNDIGPASLAFFRPVDRVRLLTVQPDAISLCLRNTRDILPRCVAVV